MCVWMHADVTEGLLEIHCPIWELFHVESVDEPQRRFPRQTLDHQEIVNVCNIFDSRRNGKARESRGKGKGGKEAVRPKGNVGGLAFLGFENLDELCFEQHYIYTLLFLGTAPPIFASSFSRPILFQAICAFRPFFAISRAPLYHAFNIPLFPLSDTPRRP